jgi:hypothetical protein
MKRRSERCESRIVSIVDVRVISEIKRPASDDRVLKYRTLTIEHSNNPNVDDRENHMRMIRFVWKVEREGNEKKGDDRSRS